MPQNMDVTLPAVVANLSGKRRKHQLSLTLVFHPDTDRIGEAARLPFESGKRCAIGRNAPEFAPFSASPKNLLARPCDDPHVSREAIIIEILTSGALCIARPDTASRVQINGTELEGATELSAAQLERGVAILLAGRICLLLRMSAEVAEGSTAEIRSSLVGSSVYMQSLRARIARVAAVSQDVLIRGETGTGKELVANAIHANSEQSQGPMVAVNMSAIPASLAAVALFGSAKGAFTGADTATSGYFEQARDGFLFLDEVGDTPAEIQVQLLRALEQREIQRVGGPVSKINLRVLAATDASLADGGEFKSALRHRLGSCELILKPLRDHAEDIGELAWCYLRLALEARGAADLLPNARSDGYQIAVWAGIFSALLRYSWPGNIRELVNATQQIALVSDSQLKLPESLRDKLLRPDPTAATGAETGVRRGADIDDQEFLAAMADAAYEPARAARILNISRPAVYRRMEDHPQLRLANQVPLPELEAAWAASAGDLNAVAKQLMVSRTGVRSRLKSVGLFG